MKVLFINVDCGAGSTGRICVDIARGLIKQGHEAIVAYGRDCSRNDFDISYRVGNKASIYLHALWSRLFDRSGFASTHSTKKFIKWIKQYNPDIIHLHNLHGYWLNVKLLFNFLRTYNKPIIWTLHDCWPFTGHCAYFDYAKCDKWKTGCSRCPQKRSYPRSVLLDCSKRNYQEKKKAITNIEQLTIVTPSAWLANLVKHSFLKQYETIVIHNGIDTRVFKQSNETNVKKNLGVVGKKVVLGVASPWSKRKGLDDFITLSKKLTDEFQIVLIGLTKKQIKLLPKNVVGIQKTSNISELVDLYSSAYVFFNPTYEDNYPTTNLEAQCCGTPVITYNSGGSPESCVDKQVVEKGNIEAVVSLLSNNNLAIKEDVSTFDGNTMVASFIELYKKSI